MAKNSVENLNISLLNGDFNGIIKVKHEEWEHEVVYYSSKDDAKELFAIAKKTFGICLLIGDERVRIIQSFQLFAAVAEQLLDMDDWNKALFLATNDNSYSVTDILYIRYFLAKRAIKRGSYSEIYGDDISYQSAFNSIDTDFLRLSCNRYIHILNVFGINVLGKAKNTEIDDNKGENSTVKIDGEVETGEAKKVSLKKIFKTFLEEKGYTIYSAYNYGTIQKHKNVYWLNPNKDVINKNWSLMLYDDINGYITLINVPANTFKAGHETKNKTLVLRDDEGHPNCIDLNLNKTTFIDERSGCNFEPYIVCRFIKKF